MASPNSTPLRSTIPDTRRREPFPRGSTLCICAMDKRIDKCAVCNVNMPKRDCPHLACGLCCLHIYAHKLIPAGEDKQPHAKRFAAAERAREELRLARAAALASAHKKATSGASIVGVSESPLLALPSEVIDRIFRALLVEPKSAASLTKEHSKLFAAFGRTFHIVDTLRALEGAEIRPGATVVMIKTTPLAAVADSHIAAPCVLLHATIEADTQRSYEMSYALEDISKGEIRSRVAIIKELEVKCGCFSMHLPGQPRQPPKREGRTHPS